MSDLTDGAIRSRDDLVYRNVFLQENKKFILSRAYAAIGHYVTESDDEWSIALLAFNDSIDKFEPSKGEFESFASLVIRRRLYDYLRSEKRFSSELSIEPYAMDADDIRNGDEVNSLAVEVLEKTVEQAESEESSSNIKDEISIVSGILSGYGFSFMDLADASPKAQKTKEACASVVAYILGDDELLSRIRSSKSLPVQELLSALKVSRKLLERHRRYIIAAIEILSGDFPMLAEYMDSIRKVMVS